MKKFMFMIMMVLTIFGAVGCGTSKVEETEVETVEMAQEETTATGWVTYKITTRYELDGDEVIIGTTYYDKDGIPFHKEYHYVAKDSVSEWRIGHSFTEYVD